MFIYPEKSTKNKRKPHTAAVYMDTYTKQNPSSCEPSQAVLKSTR